jgi:uncharacterized membrane protein HdeD (DUF308 family)
MATTTEQTQQSDIWWVFLLQGIAAIILGLLMLTAPGATLLLLVTMLGIYWLVMGVLAFVRVFVDHSVPWFWSLLIAIVGVVAGLAVLKHPLVAALAVPASLVIIIGVLGVVIGVLDIIGGFTGGGIGSFVLGVISVLIGMLLLNSPVSAGLALPILFGILLLIEGVVLIVWAFRLRV